MSHAGTFSTSCCNILVKVGRYIPKNEEEKSWLSRVFRAVRRHTIQTPSTKRQEHVRTNLRTARRRPHTHNHGPLTTSDPIFSRTARPQHRLSVATHVPRGSLSTGHSYSVSGSFDLNFQEMRTPAISRFCRVARLFFCSDFVSIVLIFQLLYHV